MFWRVGSSGAVNKSFYFCICKPSIFSSGINVYKYDICPFFLQCGVGAWPYRLASKIFGGKGVKQTIITPEPVLHPKLLLKCG